MDTTALAEVIAELTNAGELFTAYDVTAKMRCEKGLTNTKHYEVRKAVDDLFLNTRLPSDYIRTLTTVEVGKPDAFVYHSASDDVTLYNKNRHQRGNGDPFVVDGRGRLCIPKKYIEAVGGGILFGAWVSNYRVVLVPVGVKANPPMGIKAFLAVEYLVDKSGNVRVSKSVLNKAFFNGNTRTIKKDGDCIIIG